MDTGGLSQDIQPLTQGVLKGEHDRFKLQALLPVRKETEEELDGVYSKVLQYEVHHLFYNQKGLDEKEKLGRKIGKLRFKPPSVFRSFTYNQKGFKMLPKNEKWGILQLSKTGDIPMRLHREIVGDIKGLTIKHMPSGKWFVFIQVDDGKVEDEVTVIEKAIDIGLGLEHYAVDSDGPVTENPHHLKKELKKLRRVSCISSRVTMSTIMI